ncbi:MAG: hypothetical protein M3P45_15200 [Acidobacteriota bacterium]|nr:hypothetical protein [Acidobacteriota bacterium]
MTYRTCMLVAAMVLAFGSLAFAQRSHPSPAGPPSGRGPGSGPGNGPGSGGSTTGASHPGGTASHSDMSHGSPSDVLSRNPAIGGKIQTLTGQDAQTACSGFKNIGQCVAAAHVAKNLDFPGGFDALKAKMTGSGAVSLGKAIKDIAPDANAKAEAKKANKQASHDLNETSS